MRNRLRTRSNAYRRRFSRFALILFTIFVIYISKFDMKSQEDPQASIVVTLDVMLAKRKMRLSELSARTGISVPNLSILKNGRARAIRFSTLEAICRVLACQPGDILAYDIGNDDRAGDHVKASRAR